MNLKETALGIGATIIGIPVMIFWFLSLPLAMITAMRWFEWEWWAALIGVLLVNVIPGIGQIAQFVAAIFGAYYLISADFDWDRATYAYAEPPTTVSERQKVLAPQIADMCKRDEQQLVLSGMNRSQFNQFCECFAVLTAAAFTQEEAEYQQKHGQPSPNFRQVAVSTRSECDPRK